MRGDNATAGWVVPVVAGAVLLAVALPVRRRCQR